MAVTKLSNSGIATGGVLKYDSMLAGNAPFLPGNYYAIASTVLGSDTTNVTFNNIPQTYDHLQVRILTRYIGGDAYYGFFYNNDTTEGNYRWLQSFANGVGTIATQMVGYPPRSNTHSASQAFGGAILDIYEYAQTGNYKASRAVCGHASSPSGVIMTSNNGWYASTNAITRIDFNSRMQGSTSDFAAGSVFALYGIKGA